MKTIEDVIKDNPVKEYKENASTREGYGNALARLGDYEKIVVVDADLGESLLTNNFKKKHPKRYLDIGIQEANMLGFAAGLASCGKIPVVNTFAIFASQRCLDTVMQCVAYPKMNVKIIGSHGGIHTGEDGVSHQAISDLAIMRSIPNMTVVEPSDAVSAEKLFESMLKYDGPVYMRLHRNKTPVIYDNDSEISIGKGKILRTGSDVTFIASGMMVHEALKVIDSCQYTSIGVIDMMSIKPIDKNLVFLAASTSKLVVVLEDHYVIGGLSDAVARIMAEEGFYSKFSSVSLEGFAESGKPNELYEKYGLSAKKIKEKYKLS